MTDLTKYLLQYIMNIAIRLARQHMMKLDFPVVFTFAKSRVGVGNVDSQRRRLLLS